MKRVLYHHGPFAGKEGVLSDTNAENDALTGYVSILGDADPVNVPVEDEAEDEAETVEADDSSDETDATE